MKILTLDIETSPNLAHVWQLYQTNVGINQIIESSYVMCWAAKWYGKKQIMFSSVYEDEPKVMIKKIYDLICEADAIITYNGVKFDMPTLNKEFIKYDLPPPDPYKNIDLIKTVKSKFNFPSNKLDYVAQALKLGKKVPHSGHELWIQCMANNKKAWATMKKYNKMDVELTEILYQKLIGWVNNHPNWNSYKKEDVCSNCGSANLMKKGFACNANRMYQKVVCKDCGKWGRKNKAIKEFNKTDFTIGM